MIWNLVELNDQHQISMTAIVVGFNHGPHLKRCLDALTSQRGLDRLEILYIDNASTDDSLLTVQQYPQIEVIKNDHNMGFARAVNRGLARAKGHFTALVNPDTCLPPNALHRLALDLVNHQDPLAPPLGLVGPTLQSADGSVQQSLSHFPTMAGIFHKRLGLPLRHSWLVGALIVARTPLLKAIGGLDERYFVYGEDMELSYQVLQRGLQVLLDRHVVVPHVGNSRWNTDRRIRIYGGYLRFLSLHYPRQRIILGVLLSLRLLFFLAGEKFTSPDPEFPRRGALRRGLKRIWSRNSDRPGVRL